MAEISTGTGIAIGIGVTAVVGIGIYAIYAINKNKTPLLPANYRQTPQYQAVKTQNPNLTEAAIAKLLEKALASQKKPTGGGSGSGGGGSTSGGSGSSTGTTRGGSEYSQYSYKDNSAYLEQYYGKAYEENYGGGSAYDVAYGGGGSSYDMAYGGSNYGGGDYGVAYGGGYGGGGSYSSNYA